MNINNKLKRYIRGGGGNGFKVTFYREAKRA